MGERGTETIDGHHWHVEFYIENEMLYKTEGMTGEPDWRYWEMKQIVEFIERYSKKDMGCCYMDVEPPFEFY